MPFGQVDRGFLGKRYLMSLRATLLSFNRTDTLVDILTKYVVSTGALLHFERMGPLLHLCFRDAFMVSIGATLSNAV